jgi:hypothetical protein
MAGATADGSDPVISSFLDGMADRDLPRRRAERRLRRREQEERDELVSLRRELQVAKQRLATAAGGEAAAAAILAGNAPAEVVAAAQAKLGEAEAALGGRRESAPRRATDDGDGGESAAPVRWWLRPLPRLCMLLLLQAVQIAVVLCSEGLLTDTALPLCPLLLGVAQWEVGFRIASCLLSLHGLRAWLEPTSLASVDGSGGGGEARVGAGRAQLQVLREQGPSYAMSIVHAALVSYRGVHHALGRWLCSGVFVRPFWLELASVAQCSF